MHLFLPEPVVVGRVVVVLVVVVEVVVALVIVVGSTGCDNLIVFPLKVMANLNSILLHLIM